MLVRILNSIGREIVLPHEFQFENMRSFVRCKENKYRKKLGELRPFYR